MGGLSGGPPVRQKFCGLPVALSLLAGVWVWGQSRAGAVRKEKQQTPERIRVGFPEFHDQVVGEFPLFFKALPALQAALNELTGAAHDAITSENHLILNLGILAGTSMMEAVLMGINGFGSGAMKAVRSLLEASVTADISRINPEAYQDFLEFGHVERFKELEFLRQYSSVVRRAEGRRFCAEYNGRDGSSRKSLWEAPDMV